MEILERMVGGDHGLRTFAGKAGASAHIAQLIYDARTAAGLTQAELAKPIGAKQAVIARLEDAGYQGHSLTIHPRIANAPDQRLELRFSPSGKAVQRSKTPPERLR